MTIKDRSVLWLNATISRTMLENEAREAREREDARRAEQQAQRGSEDALYSKLAQDLGEEMFEALFGDESYEFQHRGSRTSIGCRYAGVLMSFDYHEETAIGNPRTLADAAPCPQFITRRSWCIRFPDIHYGVNYDNQPVVASDRLSSALPGIIGAAKKVHDSWVADIEARQDAEREAQRTKDAIQGLTEKAKFAHTPWRWPKGAIAQFYKARWCTAPASASERAEYDEGWSVSSVVDGDGYVVLAPDIYHSKERVLKLIPEYHLPVFTLITVSDLAAVPPDLRHGARLKVLGTDGSRLGDDLCMYTHTQHEPLQWIKDLLEENS